jgi:hypothetical protein
VTDSHPYSTFALDQYWVEGSRDPKVGAHVVDCERCRTYVEHLGILDARPLVVPVRRTSPWRRGFFAGFAFAVVVAACILLWVHGSGGPANQGTTYVAAKGAPTVEVLVRRDGQVRRWNGADKVRGHDALALQVACESMTRVTVLVHDHGAWTQSFDDACLDEVLPFTLVVDDEPGDERIAVVLSRAPLDKAAVHEAADLMTRNADVWALQLVFSKESGK